MSLWSFSVKDVTRTTHFPTTTKGTTLGDAKQEVTAGGHSSGHCRSRKSPAP